MSPLSSALVLAILASAHAVNLDSYRWEKRLLVVFAESSSSAELAAQQRRLGKCVAGLADRSLEVLTFVGRSSRAASAARQIRRKLGRSSASLLPFSVHLIDYDGGVKWSRAGAADLAGDVFPNIDAMPMRRAEVRRRYPNGETPPSCDQ